ncbi:glycosyltransferase involved in cell wall biosynthesis [Chromobacterium alkanivorans]|uniref:glycosyltransferase n=1 Tax=Chromobacterium alkanivorans TaxID=1071719 RepID=UPI0021686821|nr:glycosyltransferase [Chromobacterium alkanivorans]MCS3805791.1 glycosyltransferase involved in cell wall biosynthesis [Chromobacterium alkanivorans]MCS3819979.1 glycosyltransferase involved in cell wall biosynthesis [Chromobacterium alkanivorans]MCS3874736.1 glycosyltransferase involved in cell wall biosynthesis [Chromobacterium alkanivorans]
MKIALLAPLPSEQNGIADYAAAWRRALENEGVSVIAPLDGQPLARNALELSWQMQKVDWRRFDLVHAELGGGRCGEFMALEWLARHCPELRLTATVHDPERLVWRPPGLPRWLPRRLAQAAALLAAPLTLARERRLARCLTRLVTLTSTGAERLARRMRLPDGRVFHIAHGNREIAAEPLPALPPQGPLRLLYFGYIYQGKGIEDVLDALALLQQAPDTRDRVRLTLAGGVAPDIAFGRSGSYLEALRQQAILLGLHRDMLEWRPDLPASEIPALIQANHAMVLPYRESWKLSLLGRMCGASGALSWAVACGRGVVCSDARALAEEASFGNGEVYARGDSAALAQTLISLLRQPERLSRHSEQARVLGRERAWPRVATQFLHLFRTALGERAHG